MKLAKYLNEKISRAESDSFIAKWKSKLKSYGITHIEWSTHFFTDRMNHPRNKPPITIEELDYMLTGFLNSQPNFKTDVENVKNHTQKPRGKNKKALNFNELEFAVHSKKNGIKFVFVLKQDRKQKDTAMILPMTIVRDKKKLIHTQGELISLQ